jgi:hypothetical protein
MAISNNSQRDRYSIAEGDFRAAVQYIKKAREFDGDLIVRNALIAMAILCYARPFSNNEQRKNSKVAPRILAENLAELSPTQRDAHKKYRDLRNKAIAHSQFSHHPTKFDEESGLSRISRFTLLFHCVNLDELEDLVRSVQEICRCQRISYNAFSARSSQ